MRNVILVLLACIGFTACKKEVEQKPVTKTDSTAAASKQPEKEFEMYEMSEMASLMERMYMENEQLKQRITEGGSVGNFPKHIIALHSAAMTDETDRDAFFEENAANFIEAQERIYNDPANAKQHYNDAVSACIQCHEGKCGGPIPRIKKLYIK